MGNGGRGLRWCGSEVWEWGAGVVLESVTPVCGRPRVCVELWGVAGCSEHVWGDGEARPPEQRLDPDHSRRHNRHVRLLRHGRQELRRRHRHTYVVCTSHHTLCTLNQQLASCNHIR